MSGNSNVAQLSIQFTDVSTGSSANNISVMYGNISVDGNNYFMWNFPAFSAAYVSISASSIQFNQTNNANFNGSITFYIVSSGSEPITIEPNGFGTGMQYQYSLNGNVPSPWRDLDPNIQTSLT
jgi:hypothetical protein